MPPFFVSHRRDDGCFRTTSRDLGCREATVAATRLRGWAFASAVFAIVCPGSGSVAAQDQQPLEPTSRAVAETTSPSSSGDPPVRVAPLDDDFIADHGMIDGDSPIFELIAPPPVQAETDPTAPGRDAFQRDASGTADPAARSFGIANEAFDRAINAASIADEDLPLEDDLSDEEIDELLEMTDADVSELSTVNVTRATSAPALDTVVSTVERKTTTVGKTPAAVFVITSEMIRRSGARSIPEALRMAPGVNVARIDGNKWAVSIRGFNSRFANKLLVQIDGRSVYNPLFGGVYWDVQNVVLEDVAQIEVIRGPGGTVWGENAVNGVINIVTKDSRKTLGTFVESGGGNLQGGYTSARVGRRVDGGAMRGYVRWQERNELISPTDHDDGRDLRAGFRTDRAIDAITDTTLQGDIYTGSSGTAAVFASPTDPPPTRVLDEQVDGGNLLYRRRCNFGDGVGWSFQAYVETTDRLLRGATADGQDARYKRQTIDLDFQDLIRPMADHEIIYGFRYRYTWDQFENQPFFFSLDPTDRGFDVVSAFAQDTITLLDDTWFISLGTKISHNDFSGFEVQPSIRTLITPDDQTSLWASVSRGVRTPTRLVTDGRITLQPSPSPFGPIYPVVFGRSLEAENIVAYECGIRRQATESLGWDMALFHNDYDDLIGFSPSGSFGPGAEGLIAPFAFNNAGVGEATGIELATFYRPNQSWQLRTAYSFLDLEITGTRLSSEGDSPRHQFSLQSTHDLGRHWDFDWIVRYTDELPDQSVDGNPVRDYFVGDVRIAYRPNRHLEAYVVGRNLLDGSRFEFGEDPFAGTRSTRIPQSIYGGMAIRY